MAVTHPIRVAMEEQLGLVRQVISGGHKVAKIPESESVIQQKLGRRGDIALGECFFNIFRHVGILPQRAVSRG